MNEIVITDVGPIHDLRIPLPESGVVVLRGRNGAGKSHALAAIDSLISGRGRLPCRDGAAQGCVEGFGARLTIGRSQRRIGEAEVLTLEGKLDISQLVDPPIKDKEAADKHRIKALISLSGVSVGLETFSCIIPWIDPGELVPPSDQSDDPIVLASRLKRALEAEARKEEKRAEDLRAKCEVKGEEASKLPNCPAGVDEAERRLQEALLVEKELSVRYAAWIGQQERAKKAAEHLAGLRSMPGEDVDSLLGELTELDGKITTLEKALALAKQKKQELERRIRDAKTRAAQIADLEAVLAQCGDEVDAESLEIARNAVATAREALEAARLGERRKALEAELDTLIKEADEAERRAAAFRQAAWGTDTVLTNLVGKVTRRLRVDGGRLVCDTDRGAEPFSDLSPGERWRVALEIAAELLGHGGIVTVPQEAWEGLDPVNRREIAEIAKGVGVTILTAEADANETIQAEVFA